MTMQTIAIYFITALIILVTVFYILLKKQDKRFMEKRKRKIQDVFDYMTTIKKEWVGTLQVTADGQELVYTNGSLTIIIRYDIGNDNYYGSVFERNHVNADWDFNSHSILHIATIIKFYSKG